MVKGYLIGRFQPFHLGHQSIIDKIISDGLTPHILVGVPKTRDHRHPFNSMQVKKMVQFTNNIEVDFLEDRDNDLDWSLDIYDRIGGSGDIIYYHRKKQDVKPLYPQRLLSTETTHYMDAFTYMGVVEVGMDIKINATDIRHDLEGNKQYLNNSVYEYIRYINSLKKRKDKTTS